MKRRIWGLAYVLVYGCLAASMFFDLAPMLWGRLAAAHGAGDTDAVGAFGIAAAVVVLLGVFGLLGGALGVWMAFGPPSTDPAREA